MGTGLVQNIIGTLVYLLAQFLGMFVAAAMSYWVYSEAENTAYDSGSSSQLKDYQFSCLYSTCPNNLPNSQVKHSKNVDKHIFQVDDAC